MNQPFRNWLQNMYYENQLERFDWKQSPLSLAEYFKLNKYWLKREYRFQKSRKQSLAAHFPKRRIYQTL